jgi:hypothetical protein
MARNPTPGSIRPMCWSLMIGIVIVMRDTIFRRWALRVLRRQSGRERQFRHSRRHGAFGAVIDLSTHVELQGHFQCLRGASLVWSSMAGTPEPLGSPLHALQLAGFRARLMHFPSRVPATYTSDQAPLSDHLHTSLSKW